MIRVRRRVAEDNVVPSVDPGGCGIPDDPTCTDILFFGTDRPAAARRNEDHEHTHLERAGQVRPATPGHHFSCNLCNAAIQP
jgi:hypothetical protein